VAGKALRDTQLGIIHLLVFPFGSGLFGGRVLLHSAASVFIRGKIPPIYLLSLIMTSHASRQPRCYLPLAVMASLAIMAFSIEKLHTFFTILLG
jgi:hypothetical protein